MRNKINIRFFLYLEFLFTNQLVDLTNCLLENKKQSFKLTIIIWFGRHINNI